MHVVLAGSVEPLLGHGRASGVVFTNLSLELARLGHEVTWASTSSVSDNDAIIALRQAGAKRLATFEGLDGIRWAGESKGSRYVTYLESMATGKGIPDLPGFGDPGSVADSITSLKPDVVLLFWDTWFDTVVDYLEGVPTVGYLAKARFEAPLSYLRARPMRLADAPSLAFLRLQERKYFRRISRLSRIANIAADDAQAYRARGIACDYIPNLWPDYFGAEHRSERLECQSARSGINILGNIGGLSATGNFFGMQFIAQEMIPLLEQKLAGHDWRINVCGRGALHPDLEFMNDHPRVLMKGFVPDIDAEVLANEVFLLANNAGPYTGGYTRVAFVLSSGGCLVAHRRLAKSMPELVDGENCLLGDTAEQMTDAVSVAVNNPELRLSIGAAARETYLRCFTPEVVTQRVNELMESAVAHH